MMNTQKLALLGSLLGLLVLVSLDASACRLSFQVTNQSGHVIDNMRILGPLRESRKHRKLQPGESFKYQPHGIILRHGKYFAYSEPVSNTSRNYYTVPINPKHNYKHNTQVIVTITPNCQRYKKNHYVCETKWTPSRS